MIQLEIPNSEDYSSDYDGYCKYLIDRGYTVENVSFDELSTNYVSLHGLAAGFVGTIIEIAAPRGQKISIMGTQQLKREQDAREAYTLMVRLANKDDIEIPPFTKIRITKNSTTTESITNLARVFYADINMIKSNSGKLKSENELYRFKSGFIIDGGQYFRIDVLNNYIGSKDIDSEYIKFALQADIWTIDG